MTLRKRLSSGDPGTGSESQLRVVVKPGTMEVSGARARPSLWPLSLQAGSCRASSQAEAVPFWRPCVWAQSPGWAHTVPGSLAVPVLCGVPSACLSIPMVTSGTGSGLCQLTRNSELLVRGNPTPGGKDLASCPFWLRAQAPGGAIQTPAHQRPQALCLLLLRGCRHPGCR